MQRTLVGTCIACALALPAVAGDGPKPGENIDELMTMRVEGDIAVDAQGKVVSYDVQTPIDPTLRGVIDRAVASWKFAPPTVAGKPARVKSAMRVTLAGRKVEAGTEISIDNVVFYDRKDGKDNADTALEKRDDVVMNITAMTRKISYPKGYHVNGVVTMAIRANPDGTVADVFPTQCSLYFAGGMKAVLARACKTMSDTAVAAIRTWKVGIELNGNEATPEKLTGILPLQYTMQGDERQINASGVAGNWRIEARTPYQQAPWTVKDRLAQRVGTSDISGPEMMPGRSPLQFLDEAAPRAL